MLENIIINLYISTYKLYINLYKTNAINCAQLDFFIIFFLEKGQIIHFFFSFCWRHILQYVAEDFFWFLVEATKLGFQLSQIALILVICETTETIERKTTVV